MKRLLALLVVLIGLASHVGVMTANADIPPGPAPPPEPPGGVRLV